MCYEGIAKSDLQYPRGIANPTQMSREYKAPNQFRRI